MACLALRSCCLFVLPLASSHGIFRVYLTGLMSLLFKKVFRCSMGLQSLSNSTPLALVLSASSIVGGGKYKLDSGVAISGN